ncbi:hypothetical protein PUV54_06680 [Hyphococcus flavus]|uniref:Uncharacterized protein n=1 Tax=Hyphococcus flavus TaxID=1866326 RepID=A0AAE9ZE31_9PROT|nr:hypothetical protein [Hyphococcus flavus]WDI32881.1 hypothetical protein PUV54_06680 [Hyphococcus flavus]
MVLEALKTAGTAARHRWALLREREDVQRALKFIQYGLLALIIIYLLFKLSQVGWVEVLGALPESPWFYFFFVLRFLAVPVSEVALYEIIWSLPLIRHFFVFIRKRVYNFAVMGYSGEAFLTLWARRRLGLQSKEILVGVKDNNLLSAFASNAATVVLVIALALTGGLQAGLEAFPGAGWLFSLAFLSAGTLSVLVLVFRDKLMALPKGVMPKLIGVHSGRQLLIIILHAAMYSAALPGAPLMAWMTFIAMQLVLSRVPFLPNQDIVYLGAALSLSPIVGAPEAAVAGMLVAEAGLSQLFNIAMFFATAHLAKTEYRTSPA